MKNRLQIESVFFYVTIYGRRHIYTCFRYYFLAYSIFHKCNPDFTNGEKTVNRFFTFNKKLIKGDLQKQINRLPLWAI